MIERQIEIPTGDADVDMLLDGQGAPEFTWERAPDGLGVIFTGRMRRLRTKRGRTLLLVEDLVGLLDEQIRYGGSLESVRRWLTGAAMGPEQ